MPTTIPTTTSSTRPGSPSAGDAYFETDTKNYIIYDGANWRGYASDGTVGDGWTGRSSSSVLLDGSNDHADTNSNFQSTLNSGFSFSLWAKLNGTGVNQALIGAENSTYYDRLACFVNTSNQVNFYFTSNNQGIPSIKDTTGTTLTNWFHVVCTVEQNGSNVDLTLYVNGSQKATGSGTSTLSNFGTTNTPADLFLGGRNYGGSLQLPLNGRLDEAALIPSVLSSSNVSSIYNNGIPADITSYSPASWWRMGDNNNATGSNIPDQGSLGIDATLVNGPTYSSDVA